MNTTIFVVVAKHRLVYTTIFIGKDSACLNIA